METSVIRPNPSPSLRASQPNVPPNGARTTRVRPQPPTLTYSVTEAAVVLGLSRAMVYECVRRGQMRALRVGRRILVPSAAIDEILRSTTAAEVPSLPDER